ncbi:hypothetical protein SLS56_011943 [Neofusicoccum ribis]|uniref:Fungal N-terminal domain-containing protein n=1 Tax=Neofusicoccum ribis TaxID=45134 RepID=A0ABR3SA64_9PEZI
MSFGYGVELCFKLYRQVYQVAKGAPEELRSLQVELSEMTNIIKALTEDLQQPSSAIAQAGPDRLSLMNQIMGRTNEVLRSLDGISKKFDVFRPSPNGTRKSNVLRRNWNKFQYAKEVRTINDLRAKLSYQRGLLTLLLLAGNK